jgi:translocation protein SEC66
MISISASTIAPIAYLVLVLGSLTLFSTFYRRRKAEQSKNLEPWFPTHHERDIYLTLLHLENPACPPSFLKAALFQRAREDLRRVYAIRESKPAANNLLQKGSISEATFQALNAAEQELNLELQDVVAEARALGGDEWGQTILAQANEAHQRVLQGQIVERAREYAKRREVRWKEMEVVKTEMAEKQRELALKELTGENKSEKGNVNSVIKEEKVNGVGASPTPTKSKKKKNKK